MDLNQFTQFFDNPKVSVFDRSKPVGFPAYIGKWYPVKWDLLSFGNSERTRDAHKLRMSPMLAPNFSDLRVEEHAAVVPLRVLMKDYEETFNYATNREGASLPHWTATQYMTLLQNLTSTGFSLVGSLLDFLGYPIFTDLYRSMNASLNDFYFDVDLGGNVYEVDIFHIPNLPEANSMSDTGLIGSFSYRDADIELSTAVPFFLYVLGVNKPQIVNPNFLYERFLSTLSDEDKANPTIEQLIEYSSFETVQSAVDSYKNYLFSVSLSNYLTFASFDGKPISTLPLRAFWRVYYDWNTNGNFTDRDLYLQDYVYNFEFTVYNLNPDDPQERQKLFDIFTVPNRLWDMDYATSLLPTAAVDNAIQIPANSTVLDLAKLSALQKLALRLSYSSRYRDVVWNIFKIKPSDARLQQSSIIYEKKHNVGIGETLQTSESTSTSVLGAFGGRGYSSGKIDGFHIFCEEPCISMCFFSLVPRTIYKDCLHPLIHVDDILDLPIPDMDVLGNQPVYADIISGNLADSDTVLGYGRQYQEWLYNLGSIHGEFRTTLDYWYLSREFADTPVLNDDFLRMNPADDFDRIFSVPGAPHAQVDMYFDSKVTRHVHRSVRILI